jgi:hypothetical protein
VVDGNDKFAGLIGFQPDPQPYFYTVVPVKQGEKIVGGIMIAIKVDRLLQSLNVSARPLSPRSMISRAMRSGVR